MFVKRMAIVSCLLSLMGCTGTAVSQSIQASPERQSSHYERSENKDSVIVFVHGIFGNVGSTWTCPSGTSWPKLLLADKIFRDFNVYVAQYDTPYLGNTMTIDQIVTSLNERLKRDDVFSKHQEIVFVVHSLGGLIVQRLLLTYRAYAAKVPLIFFYSTPQTGSQLAQIGRLFSSDPLLKEMLPGDQNDYLLNMESEWRAAEFKIHRSCAYEMKETKLGPFSGLVVDRLSATRSCSDNPIPINEDHISIVKPCSDQAPSYFALQNAIKSLPNLIPKASSGSEDWAGQRSTSPLPPQSRFIREAITKLADELMLVSGKQFPNECGPLLQSDERWYQDDKRIDLLSLMYAPSKISWVKQLDQMVNALWGVEGGLLFSTEPSKSGITRMVTPGYGRVHDEYQAILGKPWVYAKTKYKIGPDPNLSADFRTCAYGLVAVEGKLDRLLSALDDAEAALRTTPPPDPIPDFRIDWLHQDLRNAGIPIEVLNVSEKPTPETDANPAEYFKLSNGKYIRATKPKDVTFTAEQREKARELIHIHEETLKRQEPLLEAVRIALARGGQTVSSVRFTRSPSELTFDPQRFISIDTAMGILEIRGRAPFSAEQRDRIEEIVKSELIKTLTPP